MKIDRDFMDRVIRPNAPTLVGAILDAHRNLPDGMKEGVVHGALLEFLASYEDALWRPIETAPKDGFGFYGYGRHTTDNGKHWKAGDHFWGIIQNDIWRSSGGFVFAKDGSPVWPGLTHWRPLPEPPQEVEKPAGKLTESVVSDR